MEGYVMCCHECHEIISKNYTFKNNHARTEKYTQPCMHPSKAWFRKYSKIFVTSEVIQEL